MRISGSSIGLLLLALVLGPVSTLGQSTLGPGQQDPLAGVLTFELSINGSAPHRVSFLPALFGGGVNETGPAELVAPPPGTERLGCSTLSRNVTGKWLIMERGLCAFLTKAETAQAAGAAGLIVSNCVEGCTQGLTFMTGPSAAAIRLHIPVVLISPEDGARIYSALDSAGSGSSGDGNSTATTNVTVTVEFAPAGELVAEEREAVAEIAAGSTWVSDQQAGTRAWAEAVLAANTSFSNPCVYPRVRGLWCEKGHVVLISTIRTEQTGRLSPAFGRLSELRFLDVSENRLEGEVPCELGNLANLQILQIRGQSADAGLTYLSPCLGNLTRLRSLTAGSNKITNLPASILRISSLLNLELSQNRISAPLPNTTILVNLQQLRLNHNMLYGDLHSFRNSSKLSVLLLNNNQLTLSPAMAAARDWLDNCPQLRTLDLSSNRLAGPLPMLKGTTALTSLSLHHNAFRGSVPSSWGALSALTQLYMQHNQVSSPIYTLRACNQLREVNFGYNNLTSETGKPEESGRAGWIINGWGVNIETVNLEHNQLTGPWENGMYGLTLKLSQVYLSHNRITSLPSEMFSAGYPLTTLDVSYNDLQDTLPRIGTPPAALGALMLHGNPNFRGPELPPWVVPSTTERTATVGLPYTCAKLQNVNRAYMTLTLDPSYYDFTLCKCEPGTYGHPPDCLPIPSRLAHNTTSAVTDELFGVQRQTDGIDVAWTFEQPGGAATVRVIRLDITLHRDTFQDATDVLQVYEGRDLTGARVFSVTGQQELRGGDTVQVVVYASAATLNFRSRDREGRHFVATPSFEYECPSGFAVLIDAEGGLERCVEVFEPSPVVRVVILAVSSFAALALLCVAGVLWYFRNTALIKAATAEFCILTTLFSLLAVFGGALYAADEDSNALCLFRPWLTAIPLVAILSLILTKTVRVWKIFLSRGLQVKRIPTRLLAIVVAGLICAELVFLIVFNAVPLSSAELVRGGSMVDYKLVQTCTDTHPHYNTWLGFQIAFVGLFVLATAYAAFKVRTVPTEFNEAPQIAMATFSLVFVCIVLVPLQLYLRESPSAVAVVRGVGQSFGALTFITFLFAPKLLAIALGQANKRFVTKSDQWTVYEHRSNLTSPASRMPAVAMAPLSSRANKSPHNNAMSSRLAVPGSSASGTTPRSARGPASPPVITIVAPIPGTVTQSSQ